MKNSVLITLAITLAVSLPVRGAVVNMNPTADAFVTTGSATNNLSGNNYGGAGALALSAAGLSKGEFQSVLRFDTSGAKTTFDGLYGAGLWSVQSVTLQLTAALPNNAIFNANSGGLFDVRWMQNDSWTEGTGNPNAPTTTGITYNNLPGFLSGADQTLGTFSYNASSSNTFVYTLTLASGISADVLAGDNVSLRLFAADSGVSYFFDSRSFNTAAARPVLSIDANAIPEPGTVALLALGGLLCVGRVVSRRRN